MESGKFMITEELNNASTKSQEFKILFEYFSSLYIANPWHTWVQVHTRNV